MTKRIVVGYAQGYLVEWVVPMSDHEDSEFEDIINSQDKNSGPDEIKTIWQAIEKSWPQFHEGVLVKGLVIVEFVDKRGRIMKWQTSPDLSQWDMLGLLRSATLDVESETYAMALSHEIMGHMNEDDSDDEESEEYEGEDDDE